MFTIKSYRLLTYLGLIPFLVYTYQTWCGPIEEVQSSTRSFLVFSSSTLIFISGCWWGISYRHEQSARLRMMLVGLCFGLGSALLVTFVPREWGVVILGLAHFVIWILEFFVPGIQLEHNYKIQRTVLTMTIVVCHMLVATQFF